MCPFFSSLKSAQDMVEPQVAGTPVPGDPIVDPLGEEAKISSGRYI